MTPGEEIFSDGHPGLLRSGCVLSLSLTGRDIGISILIISILITSAPPQIIRPQIPEVGDPGCKVLAGYGEE